jgi:hypothetical protein
MVVFEGPPPLFLFYPPSAPSGLLAIPDQFSLVKVISAICLNRTAGGNAGKSADGRSVAACGCAGRPQIIVP